MDLNDMPNTHGINKKNQYEVQKALEKWEDFEKYCGTNYVSEQYISMYRGILSDIKLEKKEFTFDKDEVQCGYTVDEEGYTEALGKRVRQLKNRKMKGTASWSDEILYDAYLELYKARRRGENFG